jgi:hypothetical protein
MNTTNLISIPLNISLHANQKVLHNSPARYKTVKAGKRFGKTKWAIFEILQKAGLKPGVYWYTAPYFNHAKTIAWYELLWILPPKLIRRKLENELMIELINGSRIYLKGEEW